LMWEGFDQPTRAKVWNEVVYSQPSDYEETYEICYRLIEYGRKHLLLGWYIPLTLPVRILQGMADADVPWRHAMLLAESLKSEDVTISLTKNGGHRLSEPADIKRLTETLNDLTASLRI